MANGERHDVVDTREPPKAGIPWLWVVVATAFVVLIAGWLLLITIAVQNTPMPYDPEAVPPEARGEPTDPAEAPPPSSPSE